VILPPSIHPNGRTYQWEIGAGLADVALTPAPGWLLDLILTRGHGDLLRRDGTPLLIPEGERNHRLYQLACALRRYGLNATAIAACLGAINTEHCQPPLGHEELARIAASAGRHSPVPGAFLASAAFQHRSGRNDDFEAVVGAALRAAS
jgi:Primase C terminal 1 (PriCT-1)